MTTYLTKAVSRSIATSSTDKTILTSASASATATADSATAAKQKAITKAASLSAKNAIAAISSDAANNANTNVATRSVSSTSATGVTGAIPWITDSSTLQNVDGKYYQIRGFSLTSLEYSGSIFGPNGYYDFGYFTLDGKGNYYTQYMNSTVNYFDTALNGNPSITLNAYYLMQNVMKQLAKVGDGSLASPYSVPMIRIPVTADYWLNGTTASPSLNTYSKTVDPYSYFVAGQTNVSFTAEQYQQSILDLIYYFSTTWKTIGYGVDMTFAIDLHWNFVSQPPQTSGSYPPTYPPNAPSYNGYSPNYSYSANSSKQLPLPGVCQTDIAGGGNNLTLTDNTLDFWTAVSQLLGVDANGAAIGNPTAYTYTIKTDANGSPTTYFTRSPAQTALPLALLTNIFFELYNEPFANRVQGGYAENYATYVNGGVGVLPVSNYTLNYNFTGFGQMYNTVRQTVGAQNICIIGGSDDYGYMIFDTSSTSSQWNTSDNTINTSTYNGFTTLRDAIENGTVYLDSANPTGGYFAEEHFTNVMLNLHPYIGLYSGGKKHAGYYDASYIGETDTSFNSTTPIAGFAQIITALQTQGTNFAMPFPIISTEFGQYDLPWGGWGNATPSTIPATYQYSSQYFSVPANTVKLVESQGSTYGTPYYNGNYVDATGKSTAMPGIVGLMEDFASLNVSYCAWACRPNSGGNGLVDLSGNGYNNDPVYEAISWLVPNNNPGPTDSNYAWTQDLNAWSAFQPDVITGCSNSYINYQYGEAPATAPSTKITSLPNATLYLAPISISNQTLNTNSSETNWGAMGPDFQYLIDNYYNV